MFRWVVTRAAVVAIGLLFGVGAASDSLLAETRSNEAPGGKAPAAAPPPSWKVSCTNSNAGLDCRALQTLFVTQTGQPVLTVAVRIPAETKKPLMLFSLPLGSYLPAGVSLQFGKQAAKVLPIQSCDRSGCLAQYAATEGEIAAMQKGAPLTLIMKDMQQKPLTFVVPVTGFSEAYAKVR